MSLTIPNFIQVVSTLPDDAQIPADIKEALALALQYEKILRSVQHQDPYVGLIDVFRTPREFRTCRTRKVENLVELSAKYLFPLSYEDRPSGVSSIVADMATFRRNFDLFTHGVLKRFTSWDNVVVAGGSVLAALTQTTARTDTELLQLYHSESYSAADVDLFLWGMSPEEAESKISIIFNAVKTSVPWDVVAVRKANVVSIHTQFPLRHIQIVLRLYQSPAEVLVGFDVDCCCVCFDGETVWGTPRSMASIITKINRIDMSRRSPSYELRLAKYARRGWEVYYPPLQRENVNPQLYERDLVTLPLGLARLLAIEKYFDNRSHYYFIRFPGKPLKSLASGTFPTLTTLADNDDDDEFDSMYEYTPFQIPYALEWDANSIMELSRRTEARLSMLNVNQSLHRHVMTVHDNIQDCISNICLTCPPPLTEQEAQQQAKNDKIYVRGSLRFVVQNPGQQGISGSFNPINDNQWEFQAYLQ